MDKVRDPNSKLITDGPEAQNENKHNSSDKIGRLQEHEVEFMDYETCGSMKNK